MAERWISVAEAAKALGISATTVRRRAQREQLDSRIGDEGRLEIRLAEPGRANEPTAAEADSPDAPTAHTAEPVAAAADQENHADDSIDVDADEEVSDVDAEVAQVAGPNPGKFGNYSPLPHNDVGITPGQATGRPTARLTPSELLGQADDPADSGPEAELRRYQRLAGASMILAQRQADEAHEQVTLIRAESHAWRRWCQGAWAGVAVVVLLAMFVVGIVGHRASSAQAALNVQEQALDTAREAAVRNARDRDDLEQLVRQLQRQINGNSDRNASAR
ncbi:hypothetical protein ACERK3_13880 [Phycisphaerales bacterium AB-hyl4]|uniref:Helix-turn-helix domain-containing protein n=1 Tax=Natronomicrosphaera hydrolytica TaxID=3242702 RepID=A0ABV4U711_9BACT